MAGRMSTVSSRNGPHPTETMGAPPSKKCEHPPRRKVNQLLSQTGSTHEAVIDKRNSRDCRARPRVTCGSGRLQADHRAWPCRDLPRSRSPATQSWSANSALASMRKSHLLVQANFRDPQSAQELSVLLRGSETLRDENDATLAHHEARAHPAPGLQMAQHPWQRAHPRSPATRAPIWTATPRTFLPAVSTSPVWSPALISIPAA